MNFMKHKIFIILSVLMVVSSVCSGQMKISEAILPIDEIPLDFDVKHFYSGENQHVDIDDEVKGWRSVNTDTVYMDSGKKEILGVQYNMGGWNVNEKLAVLGDVYFCPLHMMVNENEQFIALCGVHNSIGTSDYRNILNAMVEKYGSPDDYTEQERTHFRDGEAIQFYTTWKLDGKTLIVSMRGIVDHLDDENYTNLIIAFLVKNEYKKVLRGRLNTGHWMYLEYK